MPPAQDSPRELTSEQWIRLEQSIQRFQAAWQKGSPPTLTDYLPAEPEGRRAVLVELIQIDLEYRLKAGESVRIESYLRNYPELAADREVSLTLLAREYELRSRREPRLSVEEYTQRFPHYREELTERIKAIPASPSGVVEETLVEAQPASANPQSAPAAPASANAPVTSTAGLVHAIRSMRLLRGNQHEELDTLQQSFAEPRSLARELLQRNWLSPYQVNQVFQGRAGSLILGPYLLVERVGEGGMGTVYKARHQLMDRVVALKVIRKTQLANDDAVRRFHREIRAAAQLHHPNIVMAYDADHVGDVHFLVMEFVDGTDLSKILRKQGPLPIERACEYIHQALLGLEHAHEKGMVHRDLKPGNLLLSGGGVVKILDMGLARISQGVGDQSLSGELTQEGSVMGTPDYIAPEQAEESHTVDIRADIYSLGCSLYHLLTGQVPFPSGTLAQKLIKHMHHQPQLVESLRPGLPTGLGQVIRRMMAKNPAERYQTPAEAAAALEPFCRELPPGAVPPDMPSFDPAAQLIAAGNLPGPFDETLTMPSMAGPTPVSLRALWRSARARRILTAAAGVLVLLFVAGWLLRSKPVVPHHPLDRLAWESIPEGDRFAWQPAGLVAVLGEHRVRIRNGGQLRCVAISPDGKLGVAAGDDNLIHIFDPKTLRGRSTLSDHRGAVYALAFSGDGKLMASGGTDNTVILWDFQTRKISNRYDGHTAPISGLAISRDGEHILSASHDKTLRLWSVKTGKHLKTFTGHQTPIWCVAFSADGKQAYSGGGDVDAKNQPVDCAIRVWDVEKGKEVRRLGKGLKYGVLTLSLSRDGSRLLSGSHDGLRLWEANGSSEASLVNKAASAKFVALSPDGRLALASTDSGNAPVCVWDVDSKQNVRTSSVPGSICVAFLPDNRTILVASGDTLRSWDTEANTERNSPFGHSRAVTAVAFSDDGRYVLSGGADKSVCVWDLLKQRLQHTLEGHRGNLASVALSFGPQYALSCGDGNFAGGGMDPTRVWDVATGKAIQQLKCPAAGVHAVAFSPDDFQALAPAEPVKDKKDSEYGFALWDVERAKQIRRFDGHTNSVTQLGFLVEDVRVFSCSRDGTVRLWDLETGKPEGKFGSGVTRVVFNEDGTRAYTGHGDADGTVQPWDLTYMPPRQMTSFQSWHKGAVQALALSPNDDLLASSAADGRVVLWDLKKSQKVGEWPPFAQQTRTWPQPDSIPALAFAPDGRHLALACSNGIIYIVRLEGRGRGLAPRQ